LFTTAIAIGLLKFQVTPLGMAHDVMDPPLIWHCVTVLPPMLTM